MNSDVPDDFDPEADSTELLVGREPPPFTQAPDWVGLADISPTARHLHTLLCAHVNQKRAGKKVVWPSTRSLARMLKLSRRDKVGPFIGELVKIKAIDKKRVGMPARNVYVVHTLPPEGYAGPLSVSEWYERNRATLESDAAADKAIRDKRADGKKTGSKELQVTAVTTDTGQLAVTPDTGQQDAPLEGQLVTALGGRKQEEVELDEVEQDSVPASQVRLGDAPKIAQTTIDGTDEDLAPKEPTHKDFAHQIATRWITYWSEKQNTPIGGSSDKVLHAKMVSSVLGFLTRGYTVEEIGQALNQIARPVIPSADQLGRALGVVRGTVPAQGAGGRNGGGAMAGTNRHVDDISAEERKARNPLLNAVRASDCMDTKQGAMA